MSSITAFSFSENAVKQTLRRILPKRVWTALRLARINAGIAMYRTRSVCHAYGEVRLSILLADPLAEGWYDHDWPELPEITLLKNRGLKVGARVFEIGAHQCVVALMLANIVGKEGLVLAVEPNLHNVAVGKRNRELNDATQLQILRGAIAEKSGTVILNKCLNSQADDGSGEWGLTQVPAFSVDHLSRLYGVPDVLFIDVEGFECRALSGARETLRSMPSCFVEVHVSAGLEKAGGSSEELLSFFPDCHYDLFVRSEHEPNFVKLNSRLPLSKERFFLMALPK